MDILVDEKAWDRKTAEVKGMPLGTVVGGSGQRWVKVGGSPVRQWSGPRGQALSNAGVALRLMNGTFTIGEPVPNTND